MDQNDFEQRAVMASSLSVDDYLTNLGVVECTTDVGAFVLVQVKQSTWDLETGRPVEVTTLHLFHAADGVVVNV